MLNLAILASGRGTNLQSIIDHIKEGKLEAKITLVISDQENAGALKRADREGIPTCFIRVDEYNTRKKFEEVLIKKLNKKEVDLVLLAGFMKILSPFFINEFREQIMNIHPSLLPAFRGLDAQKQALEHGVKVSGCTVHFVDEGMDTGPIILQKAVSVKEDDTVESLSERILEKEHQIYPKAVSLYEQDKLEIKNGKVRIG